MKLVKEKSGFSLVELMVAVAIIAIALVSLISVILTNIRLDDMTREIIVATNAANLELERLRGVNFNTGIKDRLVGGVYEEDFDVIGLRKLTATVGPKVDPHKATVDFMPGFIHIQAAPIDPSHPTGDPDLNNVVDMTIIVDWLGVDGNPKSITLVSKRSDRGVNKP